MKKIWLFFLLQAPLLQALQISADDKVGQKIDRAIEFSRVNRSDLAKSMLIDLLQQPLLPIERATVLYNVSVLFALDDSYWEALTALNQINEQTLELAKKASPALYSQIAYNGVVFSVRYAKNELKKAQNNQDIPNNPDTLSNIQKSLDFARQYREAFNNVEGTKEVATRYMLEEIVNCELELVRLSDQFELVQYSKTQLLDHFVQLLYRLEVRVFELAFAKNQIGAYLKQLQSQELSQVSNYQARLLHFLRAPVKVSRAKINHFISNELERLNKEMHQALTEEKPFKLLASLKQLSCVLALLQAQAKEADVLSLLDTRLQVASEYSLVANNEVLKAFWQVLWLDSIDFFERYTTVKASSCEDAKEKALVALIKVRVAQSRSSPIVQVALDELLYWQIISREEDVTFRYLAKELHDRKITDQDTLQKIVRALADRVEAVNQTTSSSRTLRAMAEVTSPTLLFHDLLQAWYEMQPENALGFLLSEIEEKSRLLQSMNLSRHSQFILRTDVHLLIHLLTPAKRADEQMVLDDICKRIGWFSDDQRNALDYFALSLNFGWLKEVKTNQKPQLEGITLRVDFALDFQKKIMNLLRFAKDQNVQPLFEQLALMQTELLQLVTKALDALPKKWSKIKEVESLLTKSLEVSKIQLTDFALMQNIATWLEKASQILHSLQSSEATQESSPARQNEDFSNQLQEKVLRLTPQNSIQLLQEMQRQDQELARPHLLQQEQSLEYPGSRPW